MKVLITGGGGFLGSHLGDGLLAAGHDVTAFDIAPDLKVRHNAGHPSFKYIKGTILETDMLETLIAKCDLVYHLAAVVGVEHYVDDPFHVLNVNVNGTQNVLRLAHRYDKPLVFASTCEVYGKSRDTPFREDGDRLLGPTSIDRWCYSTSKAVGEHFWFAYQKLGLPIVIVRFFNAYGPRLDKIDVGRVITIFMGQLLRGDDLTVIGDGQQTRAFTYVDDTVDALIKAATTPEALGAIFNIGTDQEITILELAEAMIRAYPGSGSKIRFVRQQEIYGELVRRHPAPLPGHHPDAHDPRLRAEGLAGRRTPPHDRVVSPEPVIAPVTRVALKVDVDTYRGTFAGVPAMLDDLAAAGVRASFFFTLGPDHSGRAIVRAFTKPGFLAKMWRTNAVSMYGWKTAFYGTVLPAPEIGRRCADVLRRCQSDGHEVGLHAWDHVAWQDRLPDWTARPSTPPSIAASRRSAGSLTRHRGRLPRRRGCARSPHSKHLKRGASTTSPSRAARRRRIGRASPAGHSPSSTSQRRCRRSTRRSAGPVSPRRTTWSA